MGTRRGLQARQRLCNAGTGPGEGASLRAMLADREGVSGHSRAWGSRGRRGHQRRIQAEDAPREEIPRRPQPGSCKAPVDRRARLLPPGPAAPRPGGLPAPQGSSALHPAGRAGSAGELQFLQGYRSGEQRGERAGGGEGKRFSIDSLHFRVPPPSGRAAAEPARRAPRPAASAGTAARPLTQSRPGRSRGRRRGYAGWGGA